MKNMRPIMLVGTGSDVGKSWITTGICRWLKNKGYQPAPFKAQNMSLNSFATYDGLEIGRAQAVQAEACQLPVMVEMNPVLLKPSAKNKSQVVLHGKPIGDQTAKDYFLGENKKHLFAEAQKAFQKLSDQYGPIVMEGAGSISELNLKHRDIVNMRMAKASNACVYLVADIDRGGVFGSVYGTIALLEDWEKELLKGIIINKFRGDASLFVEGKKKLEELTGYPVLGVLPYAQDIIIEEEDSVALSTRNITAEEGMLNVAVVKHYYMSNYTDFQALENEPLINLYYTRDHAELKKADVIVLPGTKNTMNDLAKLKEEGIDKLISELYDKIPIIGVCGGYQMLGKVVYDPHHVEGEKEEELGLGIFDIETTLSENKQTVQQQFTFKNYDEVCEGYEIHMGETLVPEAFVLNTMGDVKEGFFDGKLSWGTYLHGVFDNQVVVNELLKRKFPDAEAQDYKTFKGEQFDKLADWVEENLEINKIMEDIC
ncbi:cobyric acid synthase [Flammeovirga aprica]|uniref:Cobyric acid synthase n=1 Tax=Flammeovirga aprica JL-4 TaxID=694437 RepID=A0A7X9XAG2_9BACT|nr:cobyric acid synthase [Flammeovirga aprica]NME69568.1 cobyric acid synthase [Flammeovirga aprica JL-4]